MTLEGDMPSDRMIDQSEIVATLFARALRDTARFKMLDDRLVKQLWSGYSSRKELKIDYEISAFSHLTLVFREDTVVFVARLLSPDLTPYLQESETIPLREFIDADLEMLQDYTDRLLFRLANRIPVDVSITSVQGKYVTLSGGVKQGLNPGDQIDIVRVFVTALHPALLTWRKFQVQPLGQARVVEARDEVAIAKLTWLIREDSVEAGDGARSPEIPSRARFARMEQKKLPSDDQGTILVPAEPPLTQKHDGYEGTSPRIPLPPGFASQEEWEKSEAGKPVTKKGEEDVDIPEEDRDLYYYLNSVADDLSLYAGHSGFSFSGPGATGSRTTWYHLINTAGLRLTRKIVPRIKYGLGGGLLLGKTRRLRGSYLGYDAHARLYWEDRWVALDGLIQQWMAGGHGALTGLGVYQEGFGGYDAIRGGVFIGLKGQFSTDRNVPPWDWFAEFSLTPLTIGRIGYGQSRYLVKSSFGWDLNTGFFSNSGGGIEWGASLSYGGHDIFDANGESTSLYFYTLSGLARYRF